ncbi:MAG: hypothetical protein PF574_04055 [Candidatus Delongbacteria bacterium]|jgi:hypothetical protein|nr:hypothetical protein [Candidatus Delongbacteria bacterium]
MKRWIILVFIIPVFILIANDVDSIKTKEKIPFRRIEKKEGSKGVAPIISVFVPGGGHFYLGNHKTGILFASTRLLLIPGFKLYFDNFPIFNDDRDEVKLNISYGLIAIGLFSWVTDVIYAGTTAKEMQQSQKSDQGILSYKMINNFDKNQIGFSINYYFK